jgi:Lon protease-like protein
MILSYCFIVILLIANNVAVLNAFTTVTTGTRLPSSSFRASVSLLASSSSDDNDKDNDEEKRMEIVRQLQETFYSSSDNGDDDDAASTTGGSSGSGTQWEESTGRILNLPLWRVGWVEVPGRSNCLNVHEGHYTNMFEKILRGDDPWYFGHLHLPGGTTAARTNETRFQLKDWQGEVDDDSRFYERERSAVVGALMRITDYRRLKDGRLVLLVQALERFVVDTVVESFPHGVAHVQLLPDIEDVLPAKDENFGKVARAKAIRQAVEYYHDYECDPISLPLPKDTQYMAPADVFGSEIAKCLPFCFFAKDDSVLDSSEIEDSTETQGDDDDDAVAFTGSQPLLEYRLLADLVLRNPPPLPGVTRRETQDPNALETLLWLALEDFCRNYQFVLPEEVLCLMPSTMDYLDMEPAKHPVSDKYPAKRRQRRLSYAVPALIENTNVGAAIPTRQILLNAPGTRARLAAVLERIEKMNNAVLGQFE